MQNAHADDFMVAPDEAPMCYPTEGRSLRSWCLYTPNDPMQYKGTSTRHYYKKKRLQQWDNFFIGAASDGAAPTVGVLGTHEASRPYKWHNKGGW